MQSVRLGLLTSPIANTLSFCGRVPLEKFAQIGDHCLVRIKHGKGPVAGCPQGGENQSANEEKTVFFHSRLFLISTWFLYWTVTKYISLWHGHLYRKTWERLFIFTFRNLPQIRDTRKLGCQDKRILTRVYLFLCLRANHVSSLFTNMEELDSRVTSWNVYR